MLIHTHIHSSIQAYQNINPKYETVGSLDSSQEDVIYILNLVENTKRH